MATLGISNRVSVAILSIATEQYLTKGTLDAAYLTEQLRTEYTGELRIKKALQQVTAFFHDNPILPYVDAHKEEILSAMRFTNDRNIIVLAIFVAKSSFAYDLVCQMARLFHVEDCISTATINREMGKKYGSNKNMTNTLYMVVPTLAEAGLFARPKTGLFEYMPALDVNTMVAKEMWKEAFYANNQLYSRENTEMLVIEPFFQFVKLS